MLTLQSRWPTCIEKLISMPTSHSPHRCGVWADYHPPPFIFLSISVVRYRSGQRNKSRNPLFPIKMTQRHTTGNPFICREILCRFIIIRDVLCSYWRNFEKFGLSYLSILILKSTLFINYTNKSRSKIWINSPGKKKK